MRGELKLSHIFLKQPIMDALHSIQAVDDYSLRHSVKLWRILLMHNILQFHNSTYMQFEKR